MLGDLTNAELVSVTGISLGDAIRIAKHVERPNKPPLACEKAIEKIPVVNIFYDVFVDSTPTYDGVAEVLNVLALITALVRTGKI